VLSTGIVPIFCVSNVTGVGVDILKAFLFNYSPANTQTRLEDIMEIKYEKKDSNDVDGELSIDLNSTSITTSAELKTKGPQVDTEFFIESFFSVKGVGNVAYGFLSKGYVSLGQTLMLGPFSNKTFKPVMIKSIQINRIDEIEANGGQNVCFGFKAANKKEEIPKNLNRKKGLTMVSHNLKSCAFEFEAEVIMLKCSMTATIKS
jgi:GTPase